MDERSFKSLSLKRKYDTDDCLHDPSFIINSFLIPCLSLSKSYYRITGFFSSSSLAVASEGIAALIKNNGVMKIITSPRLSKADVDAIISGEKKEDEIISDKLAEEITSEFIENESLEALGWMIANNRLEIRIVVLIDSNGNVMPLGEQDGMFHSKLGIFEDQAGNYISFTGSINESATGWSKNIESFTVFCNWLSEDQYNYNNDNVDEFEKYWNVGYHGRSKTITFPSAVKNKWIQNNIPESESELKIFNKTKELRIRPYQKEAVSNWLSNSNIGIFSMATGTGKTITALLALKKVLQEKRKAIVVVVIPYQHLILDPWETTLKKIITDDIRKINIVHAFNSSSIWMKEANELALRFDFGVIDNIVFLTTYDTFSRDKFINYMTGIKLPLSKGDKILIADEVHYAGSDEYRNGLLSCYNQRLGLSATPSRYLDDEGTTYIMSYFDKVVYDFPLNRAITEINLDTGETYLTPYNYYPIFVTLDNFEIEHYNEYSKKISKLSNIEELSPNQIKQRNMLLIQRSRILKNACNKLKSLKNNLSKYNTEGYLDHCIIYCSDGRDEEENRSVESVILALNDLNIRCHEFTANEDYSERTEILNGFDTGEYKVLVAIRCLDEGVDVPSTRNAFIMASTGNPKEYIQRRGRVLRRSPGKEYANIFDFVIVPNEPYKDPVSEVQILENESRRFVEFAKYSLNKDENIVLLNKLMSKYGLRINYGE